MAAPAHIRILLATLVAALCVVLASASVAIAAPNSGKRVQVSKRHFKRGACSRKAKRARARRHRARKLCFRASTSRARKLTRGSGKGNGKGKGRPAPEEPAPAPEEPAPAPEEPAPAPEEPAPAPEDPAPVPEEPAPAPEEPAPEEPAPAPEEPTPAPSAAPIYWGAWIGDQITGHQAPWDMSAVTSFEQMANKKLSLVHFSSPFANCADPNNCYFYNFPTGPMNLIREHGSIPVFSWASQSIPSQKVEPDYELSDVLAGRYDSYIRSFASAAKSWNHPFFMRFNWEMNGRWFPWMEGINGNESGESVAVWRHVHDIFASVGANEVTWVWCPNIDPDHIFTDLKSLYPGDSYVDWTCLDGYNHGTNPAKPDRWRSFDNLYSSTYREIVDSIAPTKPMMIGEISSTEYGGSKAAWVSDVLAKLPTAYQRIRALVWFEKYDSGMDWPLETSSSSMSAFASGIQDPAYVQNVFGGVDGKIQPAS